MDYRKTAQEIYDHIGKKENIISAKGKVIDLVLPVILFPQLIVPHVFAWLSVIIQRLIRNILRTLKV